MRLSTLRFLSSASTSLPKIASKQAATASVRSIAEPLQRALFDISEDVLALHANVSQAEVF